MPVEWWLAVVAVLAAGVGWRRWVATRPLALGAVAVRQEVHGEPVLRVRARLGYGRAVTRYDAEAAWVGADGVRVPLVVDDPPGPRVGAWTITLRDPPEGDGALEVRVQAWEGPRAWAGEGRWPAVAVRAGRFLPIVEGAPGRWRWTTGWDAVSRPELASGPPAAGSGSG